MIYLWSFFAFVATLTGSALLLYRREWAKKNVWRVLAFASGILLGVAFMRILPEASEYSAQMAGLGVLSAFLLIFSIEGFTMMHSCSEYAEDCSVHMVSWTAFGALALHSVLDGMAITIAFKNNPYLGQTVASAIIIHKLTDGLTLTGLLSGSHFSTRRCILIVALLASFTPLGALIFMPFSFSISGSVMGWWLGFIAGGFFYIGAADILPRLHKVKDFYCWLWFAAGLILGGIQPH